MLVRFEDLNSFNGRPWGVLKLHDEKTLQL